MPFKRDWLVYLKIPSLELLVSMLRFILFNVVKFKKSFRYLPSQTYAPLKGLADLV